MSAASEAYFPVYSVVCFPSHLTSLLGNSNGEAGSAGVEVPEEGAQREAVEKRDAITIKSLAPFLSPLNTSCPFSRKIKVLFA